MSTAILEPTEVLETVPKVYDKPYSLWNKEKGYIWLGNKKKGAYAILKPHKKGLLLIKYEGDTRKKVKKYSKTIIPGNFSREHVIKFLLKTTGCVPDCNIGRKGSKKKKSLKWLTSKRISKAFAESGFWKARGKIEWDDCPKEFWSWCPLTEFVKGRTCSYKTWWKHYEFQRKGLCFKIKDEFKSYKPIIEKPNCVSKWNKIDFHGFCKYKNIIFTTNNHLWGIFVTQVYPYYKDLFREHYGLSNLSENRIKWLAATAKHPNFVKALDSIVNNGVAFEGLEQLAPTSLKQINEVLEYSKIYKKYKSKTTRYITSDYIPPEIELPSGWKWAGCDDFYELSELYRCCISNSNWYDRPIREGRACVAYRPNFEGDDKGALCYLVKAPDGGGGRMYTAWDVREVRGFGNSTLSENYRTDVQDIKLKLSENHPERFPELTEDYTKQFSWGTLTPYQQKLHNIIFDQEEQVNNVNEDEIPRD